MLCRLVVAKVLTLSIRRQFIEVFPDDAFIFHVARNTQSQITKEIEAKQIERRHGDVCEGAVLFGSSPVPQVGEQWTAKCRHEKPQTAWLNKVQDHDPDRR